MNKFVLLFISFFLLTACAKQADKPMEPVYHNIRQPAVAGQFYPADANQLKSEVEKHLANIERRPMFFEDIGRLNIKAIMAPHAGYGFSAPVAAYSYQQLKNRKMGTVVIICNSHTAYFDGVAIDGHDAWQTPLGLVAVDLALANQLTDVDESIKLNSQVHESDHVLEVQLPFLQTVLDGDFKIVPVLFGNTYDDSYQKLAQTLADNLSADDLIVISTDMSHYPTYEDANRIDQQTLAVIKMADVAKLEERIKNIEIQNVPGEQTVLCGVDGVKTIIELSNLLGWDRIEVLHYANSGDVAIGDKDRVVGYGAVAFAKIKNDLLNYNQKKELLHIARSTVENFVREGKAPDFDIDDERLKWKEGAFITLHKEGQLRGCIGQIIPTDKALWQVVCDMAVAACSEDHRFNPVSKNELDGLDYEVSVLSVPKEIDDWQKIELGKHGVIVRKGLRSGVFLPQVATETGWSREEFLSQLCGQKAGLPPDCYKSDQEVKLEVFTAQVFGEEEVDS